MRVLFVVSLNSLDAFSRPRSPRNVPKSLWLISVQMKFARTTVGKIEDDWRSGSSYRLRPTAVINGKYIPPSDNSYDVVVSSHDWRQHKMDATVVNSQPATQVRELAQKIRQRIQAERLTDGSFFMTEAQLAAEYGASRTVTREAVSRLQALGLLEGRKAKRADRSLPRPAATVSEQFALADGVARRLA